jgi:hypothetical protein
MALIYAQAYATIAAASGRSSDESFLFQPRTQFIAVPFHETPDSTADGDLLFRRRPFDFSEDFEEETFDSPLARRGWAMQERLCSRRTIHFTKSQFFFECKSFFYAENGASCPLLGYDGFRHPNTFTNILNMLSNTKESSNMTPVRYLLQLAWSDIVEEYSGLQLTRSTDRLPGISGLARLISLHFPYRYLSGLWENTLSSSLLWVPKSRPMTIVQEKGVPSWSWANTTDAVRMATGNFMDDDTESCITLQDVYTSATNAEVLVMLGKIQSCYVTVHPEPKPVIRQQKDAWEAEVHVDGYSFSLAPEPQRKHLSKHSDVCHFDCERGTTSQYYFLLLEYSKGLVSQQYRGLLLSKAYDSADCLSFTRIGVGWSSDTSWSSFPDSYVHLG